MADTALAMTPSTSVRRGAETIRNTAVRPNRESARTMDFVSIICFGLGGRLPTTVMIWYLYPGFTARTGLQSESRPVYLLGREWFRTRGASALPDRKRGV